MKLPEINMIFIIICLLLFLIRNELVYRHRLRAINKTYEKSREAINKGDEWEIFYDDLESRGSYLSMIFDLTKWSYHAFYPDL